MDTVIERSLLPREVPDVETASEGYARRFAGEVGTFFLDVQARTVLELLSPWPGARVLEVGGGHAQLAGPLAERGYRVTVTGSAMSCRERLGHGFAFEVCDAGRLPFSDRSFDAVVAVRLLTHLERWREALAEMCRVARHAVIVDYPDTRSFNRLYGALFAWKKAFEGNTREFRCFRPGEVIAECAGNGFGRPAVRRQLFAPMVVHRAMGRAGFSRSIERVSGLLGLTRALGSPVVLRTEREEKA
ncbi:MAG: SAM-dependent methyltransferase [Acidobacteria bacterium]|nr:MAG: SAM-dependent methyltransferase [Acidobacteriota bacterium]